MRIDKLTASFGKLENESLSLHEGLNLIYAPNESGKSTWCAFIQAMLYGIDSSERAKAGYLPDKLRYAPWSGAPMEGSMELTAELGSITISRRTRQKNAPMREFTASYTGTAVPVEGLNGTNAGERLTGVSKDVFRRSAFVGQGTVAVTGSPELERRISAIVSTGEEQCSYSEADERLRQWLRRRRYNRRGLLPELEGRMDESQRRLELMEGSVQDGESLERRLEKSIQDCKELENQVTESRKRQRREALDRLIKGREETERCAAEQAAAAEALRDSREELAESRYGAYSVEALAEETGKDLAKIKELKSSAEIKTRLLPIVLLAVAAVLSAVLYAIFELPLLLGGAASFCLGAVLLGGRNRRLRQMAEQAQKERQKLLDKYGADTPGDIQLVLEEHRGLTEQVKAAEEKERYSRMALENARELQQGLEENAMAELDFSAGNSEAAVLGRRLSAERANAQRLSQQIAELKGRLAAMGDPLVLQSALGSMREEHELISREYEAISLAVDTLKQADAEIQSRFSPELGKKAAEYMALVTEGRYADVLINRDFSARTRTANEAVAREAEYLSAGTLDLMYLAVRLAVCELALPEGESCPLIIDDALVNLDEKRFKQAMELLKKIAEKRQVIVFSCRNWVEEKA